MTHLCVNYFNKRKKEKKEQICCIMRALILIYSGYNIKIKEMTVLTALVLISSLPLF